MNFDITIIANICSAIACIIVAQAMFCFFDGFYGNWFAFLANILTVLSSGYSIFADARAAKKAKA